MKKIILIIGAFFFFGFVSHAFAQGFVPLAEIPGLTDPTTANTKGFADFFNNLYKYLIGAAATLAAIMIIWGGLEYSTQDSVSKKSDGKQRIYDAIFGLILVLSPVLVFSIINPSILNLSINLPALDTAVISTGTENEKGNAGSSSSVAVNTSSTGCTAVKNASTEVVTVKCFAETASLASKNAQNELSLQCSSGEQIVRNAIGAAPITKVINGVSNTGYSRWDVTGYCSPKKTVYMVFEGKLYGSEIKYTPLAFYGDTSAWASACSKVGKLRRSVSGLPDFDITGTDSKTFTKRSLDGIKDVCPTQYADYICANLTDIYCVPSN